MRQQKRQHWEKIWSAADPREVTWYQDSPELSLRLIEATGIGHEARILDVGCGASTLVDGLFGRGFENISMLDLSGSALGHVKARLGDRSEQVTWMIGNVTTFRKKEPIDLWHDRAVLHFLIEESDRKRYARTLSDSLAPNGHVIIATFALDGPKKCSGLEVVRYGPREITGLLGESFQLLELQKMLLKFM